MFSLGYIRFAFKTRSKKAKSQTIGAIEKLATLLHSTSAYNAF